MTNLSNITFVGLGGSLTAGTGAGVNGVPWFTSAVDYARRLYPDAVVTPVNSGYGGTGSWYGLIRRQAAVLAHNPNVIFVDFAVNDTSSSGAFAPTSEALLRCLLTEAPQAKIIPVILCFPDKYSCMTAARKASRDKWIDDCLHYGLTPLRLDLELEALMKADYADADVQVWFPAGCGVHFNAACHALVSVLLRPFLEDLMPNAPVPLPPRRLAASEEFEYPPVLRAGTDNDGETGVWWSAVTSRRSTTPGSRLTFTGTFGSFGLDSNNKAVPGVYRWRIDGGEWHTVDLSKVAIHVNELAVVARGEHTVEFELVSGRLEVDRWLAL